MGGIIALSTNWLAIKMLFRPHHAKYIFGVRVPLTPGLIPKERARLATKMAQAISQRLLTPDVLAAELANIDTWPIPDITLGEILKSFHLQETTAITQPLSPKIKAITDKLLPKLLDNIQNIETTQPALDAKLAEITYKIVDDNLGTLAGIFISKSKIYTSIKKNILAYLSQPENYQAIQEKSHQAIDALLAHPLTHTAIQEKLLSLNIKDALSSLLANERHTISTILTTAATYVAQNIPIEATIQKKLAAFDVAEAESLILTVAGRELRMIVWLGGILGLLIGGLSLVL